MMTVKWGSLRAGACMLVASAAIFAAACSSTSNPQTPSDAGSGEAAAGPGAGTLGGPCNADGTCGAGLTCQGPGLVQTPERYCTSACASDADCQAFAQTSYVIGVPDTFTPLFGSPTPTNWKSKTLSRGVACASPAGSVNGAKYCLFGCANFEAVAPDANGALTSCYCLPGYKLTPDKMACEFGTSHQCSIFSYGTDAQRKALLDQFGVQTQSVKCDACNSDFSSTDTLGCHSNEFFCDIRTTALNGDCAETLSTVQFNQCVAQKTNFNCNCSDQCVASCDTSQTCTDCCTCTPTSAPLPKPSCMGDAGTPTDAAAADSGNPGGDTGTAIDSGGNDSGACIDITNPAFGVAVIAAAGSAPTPAGGAFVDGLYQTSAVTVYGTGQPPGTRVGSFGGYVKLAAPSFETTYGGSNVTSFYGKGTFTVTGGTANVTFSCSSTGPGTTSFGYTVTSATTVDITTQGPGYTSVATYTKI